MLSIRCLKLAGLYLVLGMSLGLFMGATGNFQLAPVHAHINLLGWVTLAIASGVFKLWPQTAQTRLANAFFWIYGLSLPVAMVALILLLRGHTGVVPLLSLSELGGWLGGVLFVVNLFRALPATKRRGPVSVRGTTTIVAESPEALAQTGKWMAGAG
jgi:hypothetical protein